MATRSDIWQNIMSGVLGFCALVAVALMISRRTAQGPSSAPSDPPERVDNWESLTASGHRIGLANAVVTIVEFGDFECPVCGSYHVSTLAPFLEANPSTTALIYRHWPLSYHRFALPAARASECAAAQGRFAAYHQALFDHQDSLGLRSFGDVALAVGVPDSIQFARCLTDPTEPSAIAADVAAVTALGGIGTPTILVNGFRWYGLPSRMEVDSILGASQSR